MNNLFVRLALAGAVAASCLLAGFLVAMGALYLADRDVAYPLALAVLLLTASVSVVALLLIILAPGVELDEEDPHCPHGVPWEDCPQCRL